MIRVRVRSWTRLRRVLKAVTVTALMIWQAGGWLLIVHTRHYLTRAVIEPLWLGCVLWLGPAVTVGLGWLIHATFEFSFENPFKRI